MRMLKIYDAICYTHISHPDFVIIKSFSILEYNRTISPFFGQHLLMIGGLCTMEFYNNVIVWGVFNTLLSFGFIGV